MNHPSTSLSDNLKNHAKEWRLLDSQEGWSDFTHQLPRNLSQQERDAIEKQYHQAHAINYCGPSYVNDNT